MKKLYIYKLRFVIFSIFISYSCFAQSTINDTLLHDGLVRDYILYVPQVYNSNDAVPLVLNLHGYTSNAGEQMFYGDFRPIADTANFIIVHPNGTEDNNSQQYWNAGLFQSNVDDLGFLEKLIDKISMQYNIDSTQVFSTGMSNGGYMSHMLACQSDKIAAIASVTGSMTASTLSNCNPTKAIPVMQIHGTADPTVNYQGSTGSLNIDTLVAFWADQNNCNPQPQVTNVPDRDPNDLTTTEHFVYTDGDDNSSVELFKVNNGGHTWPGSAITFIGVTSQDFSASKEIWRFFSKGEAVEYPVTSVIHDVKSELKIYPNPANDFLNIEADFQSESQVILFDVLGNEKLSINFNANTSLSVSEFPAGTYFVLIKNNKEQFYKKVLVK